MKKLVGLCLLCVLGIVPSASAQFAGGDGDGYGSETLATSFPFQQVNFYAGGDGDGYDSATLATSFPAFVNLYTGGDGDGYDSETLAMSFPAFVNFYAGSSGDGYDSASSEPPGSTTRYVAPTGSDAFNNCTVQADACATIAHAVNRANAGDILDLAAGTYTEPGLVIDKALNIQGQGVIVQ